MPGFDSDAPFAYEQLASDIREMILGGTLRPGDRLPSVRRMSVQRRLSVPTVLQAYRVLERRGIIRARPQSGFYVQSRLADSGTPRGDKAQHVADPAEITSGDLIMRVLEMTSDRTLIPLGTAIPDPELLPTRDLARALGRALRRDSSRSAVEVGPSGLEELRHQIARRAMEAGNSLAADDVVVTCGCIEAITLCLRALTAPGDIVAVESPTYFGLLQALASLRLRALEIPVDPRAGMRVDALARALARGGVAAVVVTPNVHNPFGSVMPDDRKRQLVTLLARYKVPAIEDDTYGELYFGSMRPRSLQAFDRAGMVLSCGTFSKTLAPGYRVGWTIPGRYRDRVLHLKLATTAATSGPAQLALAEYLAAGGYERHLRRLRRTFESTVDRVAFEILERFPTGTRVSRPAGGFLLWVELPEGTDTVDIQRRAFRKGLSLAPGPAFSASGGYTNCLRINAGYKWSGRTREAIDLLAGLIESQSRSNRHNGRTRRRPASLR